MRRVNDFVSSHSHHDLRLMNKYVQYLSYEDTSVQAGMMVAESLASIGSGNAFILNNKTWITKAENWTKFNIISSFALVSEWWMGFLIWFNWFNWFLIYNDDWWWLAMMMNRSKYLQGRKPLILCKTIWQVSRMRRRLEHSMAIPFVPWLRYKYKGSLMCRKNMPILTKLPSCVVNCVRTRMRCLFMPVHWVLDWFTVEHMTRDWQMSCLTWLM